VQTRSDFPAVGDWVVLQVPDAHSTCVIHAVLPRISAFVRKGAGRTPEEQVVAANIDTAFLVSGLDHNFNPRRIERYITLTYESGADPVILLNKADCATDVDRALRETESIAYGIPVLVLSATQRRGLDDLWGFLKPGTTGAL
jgi:ribosome biogenesis GTPase